MFDAVREFLSKLHTADGLRQMMADAGPWVLPLLAGIVFAETGLLIGFFLPGDSLLITAGVVSQKGGFDFLLGATLVSVAAVIGDQIGFLLGRKAGKAVFSRPDGRFIKRRHFEEAHAYYEKNGPVSIVVARFVPVLRTFVPFTAGVAEMPYRSFVLWNILGGILWVWSMMGIGYALGGSPWAEKLHHILILVILVSFIPVAFGLIKRWRAGRKS